MPQLPPPPLNITKAYFIPISLGVDKESIIEYRFILFYKYRKD